MFTLSILLRYKVMADLVNAQAYLFTVHVIVVENREERHFSGEVQL